MRFVSAMLSWLAVCLIVALAISASQAIPRTSTESLSSPPVPGAAFGPSIYEAITLMGGDAEKSLGE